MFWSVIASVVALIFCLGSLIRGWQMGYGGRLDLISDMDNRPLPNPANFAQTFCRLYLGLGGLMLIMLVLLWFGLNILIWSGLFGIILMSWTQVIDAIARRARLKKP